MKIRLKRDSRILHRAGEVVEASPAEAGFLISVGAAEAIQAEAGTDAEPEQKTRKTKK